MQRIVAILGPIHLEAAMVPSFRKLILLATLALVGCDCIAQRPTESPKQAVALVSAFTDVDDPPARQPGRKLALLVGCTEYPNLKDVFHPLKGPANDVILMRKVLR